MNRVITAVALALICACGGREQKPQGWQGNCECPYGTLGGVWKCYVDTADAAAYPPVRSAQAACEQHIGSPCGACTCTPLPQT